MREIEREGEDRLCEREKERERIGCAREREGEDRLCERERGRGRE